MRVWREDSLVCAKENAGQTGCALATWHLLRPVIEFRSELHRPRRWSGYLCACHGTVGTKEKVELR